MSGRGKRLSNGPSSSVRSSPAPKRSSAISNKINGQISPASENGFTGLLAILLAVVIAFSGLIYKLDQIRASFYIFNPSDLLQITQGSIEKHGNDTSAIFDSIIGSLRENPKYAAYLNKYSHKESSEWMFNNAGGAMGSMYLLHASITEYLIFFGTPVGTEGHTGRHTADDHFFILTGEERAYSPGALVPEIYGPGSVHHLRRGNAKQYLMPESGCWALELAQGWIPPMMPFGLADTLSSTLDLPTFVKTVWITGREMIGNLLIGKF